MQLKCVFSTCFYKQNNKSKENNNLNNNSHNIFIDDMEIDAEHEAESVKIIIKEKDNNAENKSSNNRKNEMFRGRKRNT